MIYKNYITLKVFGIGVFYDFPYIKNIIKDKIYINKKEKKIKKLVKIY